MVDYQQAWDRQEAIFDSVVNTKVANRKDSVETPTDHYLIFTEHPHVYTLGKSGSLEKLLLDKEALQKKEASFYKINRDGDITYHGPVQIVVYPILDLDNFFTDIPLYLRTLEEAIIQTLKHFGVEGGRYPGYTGVWIDADNDKARKICAMGVRCSRWVTMHGFALNVNTELPYFKNIIPCGIDDKDVTSLERELGRKVDMEEVKEVLKNTIAQLFDMQLS